MKGFQFKQFSVAHSEGVFKVGTDGVLLGAWVDLPGSGKVLDVGTGTGLIGLMIAQRASKLRVEGVDVNEKAIILAIQNGTQSPWAERVEFRNQEFLETAGSFDLVVSNPPFFSTGNPTDKPHMDQARHQVKLSLKEIARHAFELTGDRGELALIIPTEEWSKQRTEILGPGWFVKRQTTVIPKLGKPANRVLLQFSKSKTESSEEFITIRNGEGQYSEEYKQLTRDFYLNF